MQGVQLRSHSICVRCHASQQQPQRAAPRRSAAGRTAIVQSCNIWPAPALMPGMLLLGMLQLLRCCAAKHCLSPRLCSRSISCSLAWHVCIKLTQPATPLQASDPLGCCCPPSASHPLQWQPAPPSCRLRHPPTSPLTSTAPRWTPPSSTRSSVLQLTPSRCAHQAC